MTSRRPTGAGKAGSPTPPNTVSPFRPERTSPTRRPLGATLSEADRLVAYELRIRELGAAIDVLSDAVEAAATGRDLARTWGDLIHAWTELAELRNRPIRKPAAGALVRFPRR